jgi:hypothetical protein
MTWVPGMALHIEEMFCVKSHFHMLAEFLQRGIELFVFFRDLADPKQLGSLLESYRK